ncbi:6-pyruvoyl tetrahydropterin reductase [Endozoicomonas montiporae]|uniref:6-carboxy-5,6,7,8-tetrahydropterin synthase n=2 Tax=Endozoicomonas montiporae TaxID=1027273 RepID=A0A081N8S1_9GAMM|nr:6-carboxytetrahydropterin synthase [Endozoicomonas montiporae]AMO55247.1 hypothetical protein EZMO1_1040 [Endozoicomonas montiporae CL-33]KEQ14844.1 6-pyruvoyl tetrahydropterin reductase [Endozoicomonas montiporae]
MTALFVNQLTTLDFSFLSPDRGVVGETWLVDVVLYGDLDEQGMVFDFGHVKKQVKASLDFMADHRLLVPVAHPSIKVEAEKDRLDVTLDSPVTGTINCKAPAQAMLLVDAEEIATETLTPILEKALMSELPDNVKDVKLKLYNEFIKGAYYHYSHGLKKHLGDCQRIAHGHRSAINVQVNGEDSPQLEKDWAEKWSDIYIATREDRLDCFEENGRQYNRFGYTADQGYFELTLASELCYLIDTDSTVELLAQHMAAEMYQSLPADSDLEVTAYEGFNKGSIARINSY